MTVLRPRRWYLALPLPLMVLSGCVLTRSDLLVPEPYPAVAPANVRTFSGAETMPAECERIAGIRTWADADLSTRRQSLRGARRRAAKLGANAVVVEQLREPSLGEEISGFVFGTPAPRRGRMLAYWCPDAAEPKGAGAAVGPPYPWRRSRAAVAARSLACNGFEEDSKAVFGV